MNLYNAFSAFIITFMILIIYSLYWIYPLSISKWKQSYFFIICNPFFTTAIISWLYKKTITRRITIWNKYPWFALWSHTICNNNSKYANESRHILTFNAIILFTNSNLMSQTIKNDIIFPQWTMQKLFCTIMWSI